MYRDICWQICDRSKECEKEAATFCSNDVDIGLIPFNIAICIRTVNNKMECIKINRRYCYSQYNGQVITWTVEWEN